MVIKEAFYQKLNASCDSMFGLRETSNHSQARRRRMNDRRSNLPLAPTGNVRHHGAESLAVWDRDQATSSAIFRVIRDQVGSYPAWRMELEHSSGLTEYEITIAYTDGRIIYYGAEFARFPEHNGSLSDLVPDIQIECSTSRRMLW